MLNPKTLGFPAEDKTTSPQLRSPFGKAKKKAPAVAPSPEEAMEGESITAVANPTSTPPMSDHPANPHLKKALSAADHKAKQKHVFKALSAIRKAALK